MPHGRRSPARWRRKPAIRVRRHSVVELPDTEIPPSAPTRRCVATPLQTPTVEICTPRAANYRIQRFHQSMAAALISPLGLDAIYWFEEGCSFAGVGPEAVLASALPWFSEFPAGGDESPGGNG